MTTEIRKIEGFNCVIAFPDAYDCEKKYPTILFLHGAGTRGDDVEILKGNLYFKLTAAQTGFPFITVAPQCSENTWFDRFEALKALALEISRYAFVDPTRVYLMGASMGGYATWQLAMSIPECFAAAVPICGGGMYWNASRLVDLPVWAFHGALDQVVLPEESIKMVEKVNKRGGSARITIYPNNAHDAWSDTYANPEVFRWLLENTNKNNSELTDEYSGSEIFG